MEKITTISLADQFLKVELKEFEVKDKALVIAAANKYTSARRNMGDIQSAFNELVLVIKQMEEKYSITVFSNAEPLGKTIEKIAAAIDVATNKYYGTKSHVCTFKTIEEANFWLASQNNIIVKDMIVDARCSWGVYVNSVKIEYETSDVATNKRYKIDTIDKFKVFVSTKVEKVLKQWQEQNPQFNYLKITRKGWRLSLIGGNVGFLRFIKEKFFVAYSYNI